MDNQNEELDVYQTLGPNDMVYDVEKKRTARDIWLRIGYAALWVVGLIVIGSILIYIMPVLVLFMAALVPVAVFFYKRFHIYLEIGYRYRLDKGVMKCYVLYGKKGAGKRLVTVSLKDMELIAPANRRPENLSDKARACYADIDNGRVDKKYEIASDMTGEDVYLCMWKAEDGTRSVLYLDGTEKFARISKFYNSENTVVVPLSR